MSDTETPIALPFRSLEPACFYQCTNWPMTSYLKALELPLASLLHLWYQRRTFARRASTSRVLGNQGLGHGWSPKETPCEVDTRYCPQKPTRVARFQSMVSGNAASRVAECTV